MLFFQNTEKLEISLKSIKYFLQNNDCTELTSDERMSLDHSGARLTSLAEFGSSPFEDGGNETHFTQTQSLFVQTTSITKKQQDSCAVVIHGLDAN